MDKATAQVGPEIFVYDTRTGAVVKSAPGALKFFKELLRVNFVMCNDNEFTVKLTTKYNMPASEFVEIDPITGVFSDITYDPRVIIPAILRSSAYVLWCEMNPTAFQPTSQPVSQPVTRPIVGHLARCTVQHITFTYSTKTGEEVYNPDTFLMNVSVKYPCSAIVSVTRKETRFMVQVRYMGVTQYSQVKYNATNDTFDPDMAYDPRIVIPAIRASPAFIEIFGVTLEQHDIEQYEPEVSHSSTQTLNKYGFNGSHPNQDLTANHRSVRFGLDGLSLHPNHVREPHIKYVDIGSIRVVYDARTGDELDLKADGPIKSALYIDDCQSLFQDDCEFMVTFTSGTSEHMCRVVYDYNTGLFSGLTADPRIIIPYVRSSPEFKVYAALNKKKLTDAGHFSSNPMINSIMKRNETRGEPDWPVAQPWPLSMWESDVPPGFCKQKPEDVGLPPRDLPPVNLPPVNLPDTPDGALDEPSQTPLYENFMNLPASEPLSTHIANEPPYNRWMLDVLGDSDSTENEQEIQNFNALSEAQQQTYLTSKLDIIKLKLQQRRADLVTQLRNNNPTAGVMVELVEPAAKFTPRENNLEVFDFNICEPDVPADVVDLTQKLVIDGNITVENADIGTAELIQVSLPAS